MAPPTDDKPDDDKLDDKPDDKPDDDKDDDKPDDDKDDKGSGGADQLGDAGKKALDAMKRERNAAKRALAEVQDKLKKYEDEGKSEAQRLQDAAEEARTRAGKAEAGLQRMQIALDKAPAHATLPQIRAVAKRLAGESEEDMEADAEELFELLAPASATDGGDGKSSKTLAGKPREKLRGGGDPDDEPEEMNPRKLAELIGRHR
jgi:seryl-tRNA synthetase